MDEIEFYLEDLKSRFKGIDRSKYYLSYSGGRDSHFLYWFIKEYLHDTEIEIVAVNTYMEHPEIRERMYKYSDRVLLPEMKPFDIKKKYGSPCFSKAQDGHIYSYQRGCRGKPLMNRIYGFDYVGKDGKLYPQKFKLNNVAKEALLNGSLHKVSPKCCTFLKKKPFAKFEKETGKLPILGIRGAESIVRSSQYRTCFDKRGRFSPLHDLSDELLDAIYERYGIETPTVYEHVTRTGCMGCPYGSWKGETQKELRLMSKNQRKFVCELFKESYKVLGIDVEEIKRECGDV